jgi:hypothetical protein
MDHVPFEFRECPGHVKEHAAGWRRGVNRLLVQIQIHVGSVERAERVDQIRQRAAQAIHRPDHDHIEAATRGVRQHRIQARSLVPALGAADAVVVIGCHDGPAALGGDSLERPALSMVLPSVLTRR